jgi:hypothetical protein
MTSNPPTHPIRGRWKKLEELEMSSNRSGRIQLQAFEKAAELCYDATVLAQFIPHQRRGQLDLRISGLFLKRVLTDYRCIWNLCVQGYSAQAAAVATSLLENVLAVCVIAGDRARAEELLASPKGTLPWSVRQLSELRAKRVSSDEAGAVTSATFREHADVTYFNYRWLCNLKHPTFAGLMHGAGAHTTSKGEFIIIALPDVDPSDLATKELVLITSILETSDAARAFVREMLPETDSELYTQFQRSLDNASQALETAAARVLDDRSTFLLDPNTLRFMATVDRFSSTRQPDSPSNTA